jgi:hypothetical protein
MRFAPAKLGVITACACAAAFASTAARAESRAGAAPAASGPVTLDTLDGPAWRAGLQTSDLQGGWTSGFSHDTASSAGVFHWRTDQIVLPPDGSGAVDRVSLSVGGALRGPTGAPLMPAVVYGRPADAQSFDLNYTRGWPAAVAVDSGRYRLDLTPHAGVGLTSEGGSAEAGATLRFGEKLDGEDALSRFGVDEGHERFGGQPRWYVFAAASSRAVGYNFLTDGMKRSGMSTDAGSFIGDQQAGVAWRKGDLQASFGWTRRKIKAPWVHGAGSADQSMVGFQVSIKPRR